MADCIARIGRYTEGSKDRFLTSELVQDAVVRNLQVLSESTTRLSDRIKATESAIPWLEIKAFRNRLTHGYPAIDLDTVWEVIRQNLPQLDDAVRRMRTLLQADKQSAPNVPDTP
ncbi:MAG: DUF86 domain-containing protein, partial [Gammaproteobacteria bacterium]|nr:DUF86 domain-containing protein [Gammaproteobacteria bacterium]